MILNLLSSNNLLLQNARRIFWWPFQTFELKFLLQQTPIHHDKVRLTSLNMWWIEVVLWDICIMHNMCYYFTAAWWDHFLHFWGFCLSKHRLWQLKVESGFWKLDLRFRFRERDFIQNGHSKAMNLHGGPLLRLYLLSRLPDWSQSVPLHVCFFIVISSRVSDGPPTLRFSMTKWTAWPGESLLKSLCMSKNIASRTHRNEAAGAYTLTRPSSAFDPEGEYFTYPLSSIQSGYHAGQAASWAVEAPGVEQAIHESAVGEARGLLVVVVGAWDGGGGELVMIAVDGGHTFAVGWVV